MGRWPVDKYILDVGDPDGHYDLSEIGKWAAGDIAERHNADCAAYENQIADLEEERDAAVEFAHTVEREFAADTATLERLREVVPRDCMICDGTHEGRWMLSVWRILYPQPQPQREAIRQIAERHGFEPVPPQLGQASVDGETTFAAVPQPPEHTP